MGFSYDMYNNLKQSKMFLANPQKNYIGTIVGAENIKLTQYFNNLYELEFTIYEEKNGESFEFYEKIQKTRLIELQYIGWFQIVNVIEMSDDKSNKTYKTVKCCLLENVLIYRKVYDITGTFALYDIADTQHSLLHIISSECGWNIGHVSDSLLSKYRTFDIYSMQIYNLLTTKISDSFDCVFIFDSYSKTINTYTLDEVGIKTNILISKKNILREWVKDDTTDAIITKISVRGGDDGNGGNVDIRAVNFGKSYLINLDYFMSTGWVSQDLVDAWNTYTTACNNANLSYNTNLSLLKTKQTELTTLEAELTDLKSQQSAQYIIWQPLVQEFNGTPPIGSADYTTYINALNSYNSYFEPINSKNLEIDTKQNEIVSIQSTLDSISDSIDESNYFTSEQIAELNIFITEDEDYEDNTFIATDTMTDEEIIDMKIELMQNASKELARISQPQYTFTIKASNLFTICDNKDELISYSEWRDKFEVGNIITIKLSKDYYIEARLMSMSIDFDNLEDLDLTFSNKNRLDDELIQLAEIIANAGRTASSYSLNSFGYKKASVLTSPVREFMSGTLNATLNAISTNNFQEGFIDEYGFHMRKWLPDQNKYDDHQAWWCNSTLLFTDDNWTTAKTGIGLFTNANGDTFYGVIADVLIGNLILGSSLNISNSSGTFTINDNGFTATNGIYSAGINPSTPSEIINIKVNGVNKFYIDTVNQKLKFSGDLEGATGTFSGALNAATGTFSGSLSAATGTFSGSLSGATGTFSGLLSGGSININNNRFIVDSNGLTTINSNGLIINSTNLQLTADGTLTTINGTFNGNITGGTMNINNNLTISATGDLFAKTANFGGDAYSVRADSYGISVTRNSDGTMVSQLYGNGVFGDYLMGNSLTVPSFDDIWGGGQKLTTSFAYKSHSHSSTEISAVLTSGSNIAFGGKNAASVTWCNDTFQPISASDFRLKKNIQTLDLPDDLFMAIKTKQFEYKIDSYGKGISFGVLAQELETLFQQYGLNPSNYNIIELGNVRSYTDEGLYVDDYIHRVNYINFVPWLINIVQKQQLAINDLKAQIS